MAGSDVFVSYAHADRERVLVLRDALTAAGLGVWVDEGQIDTFASIMAAIEHGLAHSTLLLAFYSRAYAGRRACQWELTAALLAAQRAGRDLRERVLVINPESDARHVEPVELRDALHAPAPAGGGADGWKAVAGRVAAHARALSGELGRLGVGVRPSWYGRAAVGSARFVGRTRDMWALHSALSAGAVGLISAQSTADPAVKVAGMGGIGKSLLAQEYALRYAAVYPGGVFWVRAHGHGPRAGMPQTRQARDADRDMQLLASGWRWATATTRSPSTPATAPPTSRSRAPSASCASWKTAFSRGAKTPCRTLEQAWTRSPSPTRATRSRWPAPTGCGSPRTSKRCPTDTPANALSSSCALRARDPHRHNRRPLPHDDAERFARVALVDADVIARHPRASTAQLAQLLGIPHDQLTTFLHERHDGTPVRPRPCRIRRRRQPAQPPR